MTFYQELQLDQAGSKKLIQNTEGLKNKLRHTTVYLFKIFLTIVFCVAFVSAYSGIFGSENSIVGVVVLLCLMVFRFADFGVKTGSGLAILFLQFFILAVGPRLANIVPSGAGMIVHVVSISLILLFGCHHVMMANHSTLVLSYLLLYGYDAEGKAYVLRLAGLLLGAVLTEIVYYRKHRKQTYKRTFFSIVKELRPTSLRTRWQLSMALGIASAICIVECLGLPRGMWAGIAIMSVMVPFEKDVKERIKGRIPGNLVGGLLFSLLFLLLPKGFLPYLGMLGGIGVGFSATYGWQSVFNSLGAMSVAAGILGFPGAVFFRIFHNIFGAVYGHLFYRAWNRLTDSLRTE